MILPIGAIKFEEALQMGSETYHHLKVILSNRTARFYVTSIALLLVR